MDTLVKEKLNKYELANYSGNFSELEKGYAEIYLRLVNSSVRVRLLDDVDADEGLIEICRKLEGRYEAFYMVREKAMEMLAEGKRKIGWNLLTVLFDGIYIGDPEDIWNLRNGKKPLYSVDGLGKKIAEINFLEKLS